MKIWKNWTVRQRLIAIFIFAMILRLAFIIPKGNRIATPYRDQNTYYMLGRALVEDKHLGAPTKREAGPYYEYRLKNPPPLGSVPEIRQKMMDRWDADRHYYGVMPWGEPSSFFEPLYPLYSAAVYIVFGDRFFFHRFFLALMSSFTCILVFHIGKRLFNEGTGYVAALLCAFYPYFIFYTVFLMSETFTIFFLALSMYYFFRMRDNPNWKEAVYLGIALGLAFYTRSIIMGLVPVLVLWLIILYPKKQLIPVLVTLATLAVMLSPWIIRNYNLHGKFVLLSTRGGYNLWLRNNPYYYEDELAALGYSVPQTILDNIQYREFLDYPEFTSEQGEVERNKILTQEGIKFIKNNPELFTYLCWIRFKTLLGFHGTLSQSLIYKLVGIFSFGILFPLGVISLFVYFRRWRDTFPLLMVFGYFLAVHTLTHDGIRYRLPADPYLIILASAMIYILLEFITGKLSHK